MKNDDFPKLEKYNGSLVCHQRIRLLTSNWELMERLRWEQDRLSDYLSRNAKSFKDVKKPNGKKVPL